jgi:hypothetical protein
MATDAITERVPTPGVVPRGPKTRGAPSPEAGPQPSWPAKSKPGVSALARAPPEGPTVDEEGGRRTRLTGTLGNRFCVSAAPVGLSRDSPPPLLPAPGHLHVPLQRGSRSPALPADTSGCDVLPRPPGCTARLSTSGSRAGGGAVGGAWVTDPVLRHGAQGAGADQGKVLLGVAECLKDGPPRSTSPVRRQQPLATLPAPNLAKIGLHEPCCSWDRVL